MSSVCLVRPLLSPTEFNGYPLNLLILASCLRDKGHEVTICDFDFLKEVDTSWKGSGFANRATLEILKHNPDFVGITALCSNYVLALDLAKELKNRSSSNLHITLGGPHVSLCARETLQQHKYVDTAVIGEGEVTYPELIAAVQKNSNLSQVDGIAFRSEDQVVCTPPRALLEDLNFSPRPAYDLIDMPLYIKAARTNYLEIYAGSGCPFTCSFCSTSIVWQRKYRTMSAERIVSEIQHLSERYGVTNFNLVHDNLTSKHEFISQIASEIKQRNLDIRWGFSSRIDTINESIAREVAESGCDYVFFGVESGSEKIQRTMKKNLKLQRIYDAMSYCVSNGIRPVTSFIIGFPDESLDDIARTIRLAFECRNLGARRSLVNLLSAYTGTPVMQQNLGRLQFIPEFTNSTMTSFLEEHHFQEIVADPYIFSSYYFLDYSNSPLDASQYSELVDFFTIGLFRYPRFLNYLLNCAKIDPIKLFTPLRTRVRALSEDERNALELVLSADDFSGDLDSDQFVIASAYYQIDQVLHRVATTKQTTGFVGHLAFTGRGAVKEFEFDTNIHSYLISFSKNQIQVQELPKELLMLYVVQGLPCAGNSALENGNSNAGIIKSA
jgi:tRNA A37 methylthiotransferase MiaB